MKSLRQELALIKKSRQNFNVKKLDLKLLMAFMKIYECSKKISAKNRAGRSFPFDASSLNKLRNYFDDPLFVIEGQRMMCTPLAEEAYGLINNKLDNLLVFVEDIYGPPRTT